MVYYDTYDSPLGPLLLESNGTALTGLWMGRNIPETVAAPAPQVLLQTKIWLDSYFHGEKPDVDIPLKFTGTAFQMAVWELLREIPYGETVTYGTIAGELARAMGKKKMSAQAVGQAVGKNPVSILVPCHRVVGTGGKLTGYAAGLEKKTWLLRHEGWLKEETL